LPETARVTRFRVWGRIEELAVDEFLAVVTAIPENGDPSGVHTLSDLLATREEARVSLKALLVRIGDVVLQHEGRVSAVETQGI
jgi:hypothetical protein